MWSRRGDQKQREKGKILKWNISAALKSPSAPGVNSLMDISVLPKYLEYWEPLEIAELEWKRWRGAPGIKFPRPAQALRWGKPGQEWPRARELWINGWDGLMGAEVELGGIPRDIPKDLRVWGNAGICPHGKSSSLEKLELRFPSWQAPAQLGREGEPGILWESCCGVLPVLPLISVTLSLLISINFPSGSSDRRAGLGLSWGLEGTLVFLGLSLEGAMIFCLFLR